MSFYYAECVVYVCDFCKEEAIVKVSNFETFYPKNWINNKEKDTCSKCDDLEWRQSIKDFREKNCQDCKDAKNDPYGPLICREHPNCVADPISSWKCVKGTAGCAKHPQKNI